ncbi:SHOCT domain-containing protein [Halorubrum kocurii]|uniref:SHOCT domain-containing protein n=1 Tax=Halorubrum kocurii JCM 14978 TaxID=1230456 RepID=M0NGL2_9EURY|nr:SHOCT domain-containing protein [Halorubrum kocurii]EMA56971.1 hypothetical protein C468_17484 [Halorubrum kocurii JCM 14978]
MADSSTRERFRRNASGIAATVVTGTWLAALLLDFGWWLPFMLFGYIVIVPVVSMLFDEDEEAERVDDGRRERSEAGRRESTAEAGVGEEPEPVQDALDRLRARYAEGDLTDEQFDRKLDRLLETETPEDAAEYVERNHRAWVETERDVERER